MHRSKDAHMQTTIQASAPIAPLSMSRQQNKNLPQSVFCRDTDARIVTTKNMQYMSAMNDPAHFELNPTETVFSSTGYVQSIYQSAPGYNIQIGGMQASSTKRCNKFGINKTVNYMKLYNFCNRMKECNSSFIHL